MKLSAPLPFFYFPTTAFLVDDNPEFLNSLLLRLGRLPFYKTSSHPEKAKDIIKKNQNVEPLLAKFLPSPAMIEENEPDFLFSKMYQCIYEKKRFETITVLVVDYDMPKMKGLEVCRKLQGLPVKKIMLTGIADRALAVNAFNEGIIDRFILKTEENLIDDLSLVIREMQQEYFNTLSLSYSHHALAGKALPASVTAFLNRILREKKAVEFYRLDTTGSLLMLNNSGKPVWVILKTAAEINDLLDMATVEGVAPAICKPLKEKKMLPFFVDEAAYAAPLSQLKKYLFPATKIPHTHFYFSIVEGKNLGLKTNKICVQK